MKFTAIQALFALLLVNAWAIDEPQDDACFDFSKKVLRPLKDPIEWKPGTSLEQMNDISDCAKVSDGGPGKPKNGFVWGRARGMIHKPIQRVYNLLLDHDTTKSEKVDLLRAQKTQDANYLWRHKVVFEVKALIFFSVNWMEEWVYALAKGTLENPESIVMSYQKVHDKKYNTVHIDHLCGNIVLTKINSGVTDIYLYEETKAAQRTDEDTKAGLLGTLMTLRAAK